MKEPTLEDLEAAMVADPEYRTLDRNNDHRLIEIVARAIWSQTQHVFDAGMTVQDLACFSD